MNKDEFFRKINLLCADKKISEAVKLAEKAYKECKDECFLNEITEIYVKQNNKKEAIKYYEKIYKLSPTNIKNIKKLAYYTFISSDFKQALKYYKIILNYEPEKAETYFNLAVTYHFMKKKDDAFDYYNFAIKLNPKYITAINNLGLLCYENGHFKESRPYFKRAIKISPNHPEAYHHMGVINREYYKDYELSKWYLKKAYRLDPQYLLNSYQLGLTYKKLGDKENAKLAFENCLKLNPNHNDSKKELASL